MKFLDDLMVVMGCILICIGTYVICPVATLFVAGGMLIAGGFIVGASYAGGNKPK